jgi:hypothetical protein
LVGWAERLQPEKTPPINALMDAEKHPVLLSVATGFVTGAGFSVVAYFRFAHRSLGGTAVGGVGAALMMSLLAYQSMRPSSRVSHPIPGLRLVTPSSAYTTVLGFAFIVFAVLARDWGYLAIAAPLFGSALALVGLRYVHARWTQRRRSGGHS